MGILPGTMLYQLLLVFLEIFSLGYGANIADDKCRQCKFLVETFKRGMENTKKAHFAGGNTDWEERNLGRYGTSETRLIEVLESTCRKEVLADSTVFDSVKDIKFKCHGIVEEHEELLEKWFFKLQDSHPDLGHYFCIESLKRCCPEGHFGPICEPCPAVSKNLPACFGRGKCDGDGYRGGNGKCKCDHGYVGAMCSNCDAHFYPINENASAIECAECFNGCASGCTAAGPKGCRACRTGYIWDAEEGCKDINECLEDDKCTKANEVCTNTIGSYRCDCGEGFRRNSQQECEIDIEAKNDIYFRPDIMLKGFSYAALFVIGFFVVYFNPKPFLIIALFIALGIAFFIEYYVSPTLFTDDIDEKSL